MKFEVRGAPIDLADELEEEFVKDAKDAVRGAAEILRGHVQRTLRKSKGPPAAAPGEPPAERSGDLAKSWKILPVRVRGRAVSSGIYSEDPSAARLEYGKVDKRGIRTFPHPYLEPAARDAEGEITDAFRKVVTR